MYNGLKIMFISKSKIWWNHYGKYAKQSGYFRSHFSHDNTTCLEAQAIQKAFF